MKHFCLDVIGPIATWCRLQEVEACADWGVMQTFSQEFQAPLDGRLYGIASANPPMHRSSTGRTSVLSISRRNDRQGSGGCLCGIWQDLRIEIRQKIPVKGVGGTLLPKPPPFRLGKRLLAQSVFARQACARPWLLHLA